MIWNWAYPDPFGESLWRMLEGWSDDKQFHLKKEQKKKLIICIKTSDLVTNALDTNKSYDKFIGFQFNFSLISVQFQQE